MEVRYLHKLVVMEVELGEPLSAFKSAGGFGMLRKILQIKVLEIDFSQPITSQA